MLPTLEATPGRMLYCCSNSVTSLAYPLISCQSCITIPVSRPALFSSAQVSYTATPLVYGYISSTASPMQRLLCAINRTWLGRGAWEHANKPHPCIGDLSAALHFPMQTYVVRVGGTSGACEHGLPLSIQPSSSSILITQTLITY